MSEVLNDVECANAPWSISNENELRLLLVLLFDGLVIAGKECVLGALRSIVACGLGFDEIRIDDACAVTCALVSSDGALSSRFIRFIFGGGDARRCESGVGFDGLR